MRSIESDGVMKIIKDMKDDIDTRQEKEEGKGLSENDFTNELKEDVEKIPDMGDRIEALENRKECEELTEEEIQTAIDESFS